VASGTLEDHGGEKKVFLGLNGVWELKYGVISAKFVTHQAGKAARVTNYLF
jgi:hypothetical protein